MKPSRAIFIGKIFIFIIILFWCAGILTAQIFPVLYPISKLTYSHVCHQNQAKTIFLFNKPLLVCARCTGIYAGCLLSSSLILFIRLRELPIKFLLISSLPIIIDVMFVQFGIMNYSKYSALISGFIFGSITFLYIWNGIEKMLTEKF